jgi:hypothetical protein
VIFNIRAVQNGFSTSGIIFFTTAPGCRRFDLFLFLKKIFIASCRKINRRIFTDSRIGRRDSDGVSIPHLGVRGKYFRSAFGGGPE